MWLLLSIYAVFELSLVKLDVMVPAYTVESKVSHWGLYQSQRINVSVELSNLPLVQLSRNSVLPLPFLRENKYTYISFCLQCIQQQNIYMCILGYTVLSMREKKVVTHPVSLYCLDFGPVKGKI